MLLKMPSCMSRQHPKRFENQTNTRPRKWVNSTPRLSDTAADLTEDYTEQSGMFVKLQFEEGEVDFVSAPNLLDDAWDTWEGSPQNSEKIVR